MARTPNTASAFIIVFTDRKKRVVERLEYVGPEYLMAQEVEDRLHSSTRHFEARVTNPNDPDSYSIYRLRP